MRFFKKRNIKKGKTFHKRKSTKKVFQGCVAVLSLLYFLCLKTPFKCATLIPPYCFYFLAVNKLLFFYMVIFMQVLL